MANARQTLFLLTTAVLALSAAPALAQDSPGDIIVTARRSEERLQDVPISITVVSQQAITNRNLSNGSELATYTPSLSVNSRYGPESASFAIRGFTQNQNTAPSVGVYFADVPVPRAQGSTAAGNGAPVGSLFDLSNIQVLKGPQGTLFGRNTTGGAILLVPQKPTDRFEGYVEGSYGNYDMKRVQAVVNLPVMDTLRVRLGVDRQKRDGYLHNISGVGPSALGDVDYISLRFSAVADLSPDVENYMIATYGRSSTNGIVPKVFSQPAANIGRDPYPQLRAAQIAATSGNYWDVASGLPNSYQTIEQWAFINTTKWNVADTVTIKNIVSYAEFRQRQAALIYGENPFQAPPPGTPAFAPPSSPYYVFGYVPQPHGYNAAQSTFSEELQIQGRTSDGRLTYQLGGYLELSDPLNGFGATYTATGLVCTDIAALQCQSRGGAPSAGAISNSRSQYHFRDLGIYGQATFKLTSKLSLTGGLRYTSDVVRGTGDSVVIAFPNRGPNAGTVQYSCSLPGTTGGTSAQIQAAPLLCSYSNRQSSAKPTWLIDLDYKPTEDILLYAKYARGYRQGGLNMAQPGIQSWGPEKVEAYEVGAKTSWRGPIRGSFNVAGFWNDFTSQQIQVGLLSCGLLPAAALPLYATCANPAGGAYPASAASPANAGKSRIRGVEVEASIIPFEGFTIEGSYAYLDARLISITPVAVPTGYFSTLISATAGGVLSLSPKNKYTATASYTLPLDDSAGKITLSATYSHQDKMFGDGSSVGADQFLSPQNNLNLNLNWSNVVGTPVDLGLFATNVTQEKYHLFNTGAAGGFDAAILNLPRMYGIRLRYRLGS